MGRDGEWIGDEADEDGWEEDDWPDAELLDDQLLDDEWLDDDPAAGPGWPMGSGGPTGPGWPTGSAGLGSGYGKRWGHGGVSGFPGWMAVAVVVMAATAGVAVGFFLIRGAPVASATAGARSSASAPASAPASSGNGAGLPVRPGLPG